MALNNTPGDVQLAENRGRGKNRPQPHFLPEPLKKGSNTFHAADFQGDGSICRSQRPFFSPSWQQRFLVVPPLATSIGMHTNRLFATPHPRQPVAIPIEPLVLAEVQQVTKATVRHFQFPRQRQDQPAPWLVQ